MRRWQYKEHLFTLWFLCWIDFVASSALVLLLCYFLLVGCSSCSVCVTPSSSSQEEDPQRVHWETPSLTDHFSSVSCVCFFLCNCIALFSSCCQKEYWSKERRHHHHSMAKACLDSSHFLQRSTIFSIDTSFLCQNVLPVTPLIPIALPDSFERSELFFALCTQRPSLESHRETFGSLFPREKEKQEQGMQGVFAIGIQFASWLFTLSFVFKDRLCCLTRVCNLFVSLIKVSPSIYLLLPESVFEGFNLSSLVPFMRFHHFILDNMREPITCFSDVTKMSRQEERRHPKTTRDQRKCGFKLFFPFVISFLFRFFKRRVLLFPR